MMKLTARWLLALPALGAILVPLAADSGGDSLSNSRRPELEYLQAVNRAGPPQDPQLLFLLTGAIRQRESSPRGR